MSTQPLPAGERESLQYRVAGNIRRRAGFLDLSRADVARHLGVNSGTVSRKWLGGRAWSWDEIESLAGLLGVEVEYFVRRHDESGQPASRLTAVPYTVRDSNPEPIGSADVLARRVPRWLRAI